MTAGRKTPEAAIEEMARVVGTSNVTVGDTVGDDYTHDECLTEAPTRPAAVVRPSSTAEVAAVVTVAREHQVPLVARGSGTGLSGGCTPAGDQAVVISFERMRTIIEVDASNHVAVVQPGVTLQELDAALAPHGLVYPVFPGELSASLGGNVATNAGGMRAVRHGVTRHHVLGLEIVLGTGEIVRTGGKYVKSTAGYDLTQLVVGSEGTLALVCEATLRLHPRPDHAVTLLAPFATVDAVAAAVPPLLTSGLAPLMIEYIDQMSMAGITAAAGLELGIPTAITDKALAYLVVVTDNHRADRLAEDAEALGALLTELGALDVFILPSTVGTRLIEARERAFWSAKAAGADDIVDVVVPRAAIPDYLGRVAGLAVDAGALVIGCGHAGDGNVHLSVFQPDVDRRRMLMTGIIATGIELGGAVSGEHGIGRAKKAHFLATEDPVKVRLMHGIKQVFDPGGILNPGAIFD
jgi:glycolate oxidase